MILKKLEYYLNLLKGQRYLSVTATLFHYIVLKIRLCLVRLLRNFIAFLDIISSQNRIFEKLLFSVNTLGQWWPMYVAFTCENFNKPSLLGVLLRNYSIKYLIKLAILKNFFCFRICLFSIISEPLTKTIQLYYYNNIIIIMSR